MKDMKGPMSGFTFISFSVRLFLCRLCESGVGRLLYILSLEAPRVKGTKASRVGGLAQARHGKVA